MRTKFSFIVQAIATGAFALSMFAQVLPVRAAGVPLSGGDLIKLPDDMNPQSLVDTAVYYFGADGLRYVFPNSKTYFTWYSGFNNVKIVDMTQLGTIGIGGNVTYRPGSKMIKIESDPKVYAVDAGGTRRWVTTEAIAIALYGSNWNTQIDDVPDSFFTNYPLGDAIDSTTEFNKTAVMNANTNINSDKGLAPPVEIAITANGGFLPLNVTVTQGRTVRWTNNTAGNFRVASNPHPAHSDLPGFDSANIPAGLNYVYKFRQAGTWGFHNHANPGVVGTVMVTP